MLKESIVKYSLKKLETLLFMLFKVYLRYSFDNNIFKSMQWPV